MGMLPAYVALISQNMQHASLEVHASYVCHCVFQTIENTLHFFLKEVILLDWANWAKIGQLLKSAEVCSQLTDLGGRKFGPGPLFG